MEGVCEDDLCWLQLDDFRMLLIKNIDPSRITPYLRQCQVLSAEDEEQLFNDPTLVIRRRKVGALLDILQRTGVKGYTAFLESLELDYPQLYSRITGKEPNKTFSILIDTAGESGLTQFLMSELSRLQRALQDERRRRQQACSAAKEQEVWSRQQQLRDRELKKLTERIHKVREERDRLSEEVKQLRDHNYSLMADINALSQEKSNALLANRDLQIEVERLKHTVLRVESQTRLLKRRTMRPLQESRSLALPSETFFHPNRLEELKEEKQEEKKEEKQEEKKEEKQQQKESPVPPQMNLLTTVFRLRKDLHRAEEQRARTLEEKEELELRCAKLKGDVRMYRQRNKQTVRQLEEVIRERDKALSSRAEQQEEARQLLQEKDQYREQVRQLTEQSDRLELLLLRSQGEELQLKTRLRKLTCNNHQCERSSDEEEEPRENTAKGSSEEVRSGTSGENEEVAVLQQHDSPLGGATESEQNPSTTASWTAQLPRCHGDGGTLRPASHSRNETRNQKRAKTRDPKPEESQTRDQKPEERETRDQTRTRAKPEESRDQRPETRREPRPETRNQKRAETRDQRPETRREPRPETRNQKRAKTRDPKPEESRDQRPETRREPRPEPDQKRARPEPRPEPRPETRTDRDGPGPACVQLSRSLLAGRKETRTDCLSAEDSNTHCSMTSRLLRPLSSRGQQVDDDDNNVEDVSRLPDSVVVDRPSSDIIKRMTERKRRKHEEALKQLQTDLTELAQVCETQVRTISQELLSFLQDVDLRLNTLKDRMEHLEHISLQEMCALWEEVEQEVKLKKTSVMELNHKLTECETRRSEKIRVVLRMFCHLLEKISFLPPPDICRLIHTEATMLNQSLLANRRSAARLLLRLQKENLQQESLLRLHWEECLSRWRRSRISEVTDRFRSVSVAGSDAAAPTHSSSKENGTGNNRLVFVVLHLTTLIPPPPPFLIRSGCEGIFFLLKSITISLVLLTSSLRSLCSSDEQQQLVSVQQTLQKMKQTERNLTEQRDDIIYKICSLVPPTCSTALVSDWFSQMTGVNQQIESLHADFLHQLRCCYEQIWQDQLDEVQRCEDALTALQLSEEEVNDIINSELLSLIGRSQSQDEERLAALDLRCDTVARHALTLSRCVFVVMRGAVLLWETHSRSLERREEELQQHVDDLRVSQQQHIQRKKVHLDDLLGGLRQESSESALKTSLNKTVRYLQDVKHSYRQCVSEQCQLLNRLPSVFLEELLSYSSSLSSFFHLDHTYRPSPEELQDLLSAPPGPAAPETSGGAEVQKPEKTNRPISCQKDNGPAQPSQDWLTEAESSLLDLCDINIYITFTSTRGVVYSGPTFRCHTPDLLDDLQQHLSVFPVDLLTHTLSRYIHTLHTHKLLLQLHGNSQLCLVSRTRTLFLDHLERHFHDVLNSAIVMVTDRKEAVRSEQKLQLQQLNPEHIQTHVYQPRLGNTHSHLKDLLWMAELQKLQTSISRRNQEFIGTVSNMEDEVLTADSSQRLKAVSTTLQDCLDQHIKDSQHCQTTFRQTVHIRLEEARNRNTQFLNSFRLFSEGGDFAPQEVKLFQRRLREENKQISVMEEAIYADLEAFESKSLQQLKEASGRFEEKLSFLKSEVTFMEKIQKMISSTQVHIKAEAASSNQQQAAISSKLDELRTMTTDTQVSPDQVCSFLSSVNEELRKRCQYLDFSLDSAPQESLSAPPQSKKQVRLAPPPGFLQPSRTGVDLLDDPVVDVIQSLNRFCTIQDVEAATEQEERGGTAAGKPKLQTDGRLCLCRSKSCPASPTEEHRVCQHIETDMLISRLCFSSFSSRLNSVLWTTNDVLLLVAEDFYRGERCGRFLLLPDSLDQWAESMQQRLLGHQEQARRFLSASREELLVQLCVLEELLRSLPAVLIGNHERQQGEELREAVGGVRLKLKETVAAAEKEKCVNVRQLRASLRGDELQTVNSREELRQQQLHAAVCRAHLEIQECVRVRGEEFVTSLASLTEKLLRQLDDLLTLAETEAASSQQHCEDGTVTMETRAETGSRTWSGIPYLPLPTNNKADQPASVAIATTASITTTRCTLGHLDVIEQRDAAVKRFEQLFRSEISRSVQTSRAFDEETESADTETPEVRLPFGIKSAPEIFHRAMEQIIEGLEGVRVYIDDIISWGSTLQEHNLRLYRVMERIQKYGLKLNKNKCEFRVQEILFLGDKLTAQGVQPDQEKIKAILNMPKPTDKTGVLRIMGMVNFMGKFIPNLTAKTSCIRELLHNDCDFGWMDKHENEWQQLKKTLTTVPVLAFYDHNKKIKVSTDASKDGIGAVVLQAEGKHWKPVAYASRAMTRSECKYAQIEKECLGVAYGLERFHRYIYGLPSFIVETDHRPLVSIIKKNLYEMSPRIQRLMMKMQRLSIQGCFHDNHVLLSVCRSKTDPLV
ncbi:hypothetical protein L3Q82_023465 [Scortum barcoo]|uniref:Uncharacterized protein n=1 Tax=Scortum barcoo TaxID=214431 RepID=A0ACB8WZF1_9TELE|nr:hypothetical protein L3Q82_023465 [Scortum barcoo]